MSAALYGELLGRARSGDDSAYEELWQLTWRRALAMAREASHSQDPEDVAAEAFTRILIALRTGGGPTAAFIPYLRATIRNVAARAATARREYPADPHLLEAALDPERSAEAAAISSIERARLAAVLAGLPPRWRQALVFSEIYGLPPREWAPLMHLKPRAASVLAQRAKAGLRAVWLAEHPEPEE